MVCKWSKVITRGKHLFGNVVIDGTCCVFAIIGFDKRRVNSSIYILLTDDWGLERGIGGNTWDVNNKLGEVKNNNES